MTFIILLELTYKSISNFSFKDNLDFVTVQKFRYAYTRLRVASYSLEIETGRRHKPNRTSIEERKCLFVLVWKMKLCFGMSIISRFTQRIYEKYYWNGPNIPKCIQLSQSENKKKKYTKL